MESYRQDLDGMSGAIIVEGIDRYLPELRHMEERVMVLRDAELDEQGPQRDAQSVPRGAGLRFLDGTA